MELLCIIQLRYMLKGNLSLRLNAVDLPDKFENPGLVAR